MIKAGGDAAAPATRAPELSSAMAKVRGLFWSAGLFSCAVNILMLTGPLFMLQVYDRVLASRSIPTLTALFVLVAGLFLVMGVLDYLRGRILARAGARMQSTLDARVFTGTLRRAISPNERARPNTALRDLEGVQQFLSGPAPFAFFDAPWTPVYIGAIFILHWQLGAFACVAGVIIFIIALANEKMTRKPEAEARISAAEGEKYAEALRREGEAVKALGLGRTALEHWRGLRRKALGAQIAHSDRAGAYQTLAKTFRMFLQSAILALGALLAVQGDITPGAMIAGSILMGRALAPVDQAIAHWRGFLRARRGWSGLGEFLNATPAPPPRTALPEPRGHLTVAALAAIPPGARAPTLRGISFEVKPGEAVGVIGPSASGKSTLARVLTGIWPPVSGEVRLDGATLDQWDPDQLGLRIGYLPQDVGLFSGTVASNIARLQQDYDPAKVVEAAQRAGAHELILRLPEGYDTEIGEGGGQLSGGQRQRVGLARALYGDPPLIILDEPNAHLDGEGEQILVRAIAAAKKRGRAVIVMAHRPNAIRACDRLLVLRAGHQADYGPRDEVLRRVTEQVQPQKPGAKRLPTSMIQTGAPS